MGVPQSSPEQRQAALEKAAAARRVRAEVKQLLKTGSLTLPRLFKRADSELTGEGSPGSPFAEITEDDIDNLLSD